ncbi:MAG: TonB-dependent receptor [Termitinemataceae bacterium]|nr:MAG: TonB-dependent receptor [Termitinemataceae bacterium]
MKSLRRNCAVFVIMSAFALVPAVAQESDDAIALPEARVSAEKETSQFITQEQMERRGDNNLTEAMRWVPGVFIQQSAGQRNEFSFLLRGFGPRSVPVYIDGVMWGDPYNAQVDYSRFLTGDLESIEINKGYSSIMLGSSNLGGAIVMRTAKPKEKLEIGLKTSWDFDAEGYAGNTQTLNAGTKLSAFYAKVGFQWHDVEHWSLPDSFEPITGNPQESGKRIGSNSTDMKISGMVGFTPNDALDIWATYAYSHGEKGLSPTIIGSSSSFAVWEWPYINRHTASLNGEFKTDTFYAKLKGFFDKYDNRLNIYGGGQANLDKYYEGDHSTVKPSDYDDYVAGANIEAGININEWNKIAATVQYQQNSHKSYRALSYTDDAHNDDTMDANVSDNNIFAGLEYTVSPFKPFTAIAGFGTNIFMQGNSQKKEDGAWKDAIGLPPSLAFDGQVGLFYDITENNELHLSWALKSRFPTLKEKFQESDATGSTKYVSNPDLEAESAHHFELGYKGYFDEKINVNAAAFASYAFNSISLVTLSPTPRTVQYQNIDEVLFYGFEAGTEMYLNKYLQLGASVGFTKYDIIHSETEVKFLENFPELTTNAYMVIRPFEKLALKQVKNISIIPSFEYVSSKEYTSGSGASATKAIRGSHTLAHIKASVDITKYASFSFTVNNLFDELYESATGYPQAGRSFNLTLLGKY